MPQKRLVDIPAVFAQCLNRPLHINRIPKDNSADDEIESACTVALILVTAIAEFTEPVQEDGTSLGDRLGKMASCFVRKGGFVTQNGQCYGKPGFMFGA